MARPISDEELQLKKRARRRLVGAVVLVTVAAVLLPMVLDSEPKPVGQNVSIQIPSPDSGDFKRKASATAPTSDARPIKGMPEAPAKPEAPTKGDAPAVAAIADPAPGAKEPVKPPPVERSKDGAALKEASADAVATAGGAYVVQVAALADAGKAKQLEKQVAGTGLKTYTEVINTQAGERTRVRVGPYATREAAESARAQLKKAGLDGQVVPR